MAIELGLMTLGNSLGLLGLLGLIPFIIIYLIRPKPQKLQMPSLMFLLTSKEVPKQQSFLKNFARDWLFLVQLLIILFLILHLTQPFTEYSHDITAENTVIILDASGSMHAKEGRQTRFEKGKAAAIKVLAGKNTIILAKSAPKIIVRDADFGEARDALSYLQPAFTPTAIGEAIVLAGEILGGKEGRVVVISDFLNNEGIDPVTAKSVLEGRGFVVNFINPGAKGKKDNVGIIDVEIDREVTTIFTHNFNDKEKSITLTIGDLKKDITIPAQTTETYSFSTPAQNMQLRLSPKDDFDADNTVYIAVPQKNAVSVLVISNNKSIFVKNALESSVEAVVEVGEPPIVPSGRYDLYVIHGVEIDNLLPGTFEGIQREVEAGASVVIAAQDNLGEFDFRGMLPVTILGSGKREFIQVEQLNTFTKNVDFGAVNKHLKTEKKQGAVSIATAGNSSILTFMQLGKGKAFYYGIIEEANDFKLSPSYPVFWVKLMEFLVDQENINDLNAKTGETRILEEVSKVKTPSKTIKQNAFIFDEVGYYEFNQRKVAANMLSQAESDIELKELVGSSDREIELKPVKETREYSFEMPIILLIFGLMLFELIYIKIRGDI